MKKTAVVLAWVFFAFVFGLIHLETTHPTYPLRIQYCSWLGCNNLDSVPLDVCALAMPEIPGAAVPSLNARDIALLLKMLDHSQVQLKVLWLAAPLDLDQMPNQEEQEVIQTESLHFLIPRYPVVGIYADAGRVLENIQGGQEVLPALLASPSGVKSAETSVHAPEPDFIQYGAMTREADRLGREGQVPVVVRVGAKKLVTDFLQVVGILNARDVMETHGRIPGILQLGVQQLPVNTEGCTQINPYARQLVKVIPWKQGMQEWNTAAGDQIQFTQSQILLKTQQKHQKIIVAYPASQSPWAAYAAAALAHHLIERNAALWVTLLLAGVAATIPWWKGSRGDGFIWSSVISGVWVLMALGCYQQMNVVLPVSGALILPVLAWLGSGCWWKEKKKMAAEKEGESS